MKKLFLGMMIAFSSLANAADTGLDPQYIKIKVYRFAVSTSIYCTNPQVVFTEANPAYEDVLLGPTLGSGILANGTYKCVMLEISDKIKFAADQNTDSGGCIMGQENEIDVCRQESSKSIEGVVTPCILGEDKVTLYLSTASTNDHNNNNGNAFTSPILGDLNLGLLLDGALTVSASGSGTFVVDGRSQVQDILNNGVRSCELNAPVFKFR
jgi:hypothetical protein